MAKNKGEEMLDEAVDEVGPDPRVYELGFHLDPELPTEEVKKAFQTIKDTVASCGSIVAESEPEKIPLAYTISRQEVAGRRDFDSAYFSWIVYETTPDKHSEVIALVGSDAHVIRCIDVMTTKDAARHALEMKELQAKVPQPEEIAEEHDETVATELDAAIENVVI